MRQHEPLIQGLTAPLFSLFFQSFTSLFTSVIQKSHGGTGTFQLSRVFLLPRQQSFQKRGTFEASRLEEK